MPRAWTLSAFLLVPALVGAQPPGVEEPMNPEATAEVVGRWVAETRDMNVVLGLQLTIENGALTGELFGTGDIRMRGPAITAGHVEGDRVTLTIEPVDEGEEPGTLVLQRTRRGLRVVRSDLAYPSVRGRPTLTRRDELWYAMRITLVDMAHDGDGIDDARPFVAATEAVREGVRSAGRGFILDDRDQAMCLIDLASSPASDERIRARAHALAQAAGRGSVCDVDQSTMTPGEAGPTASGCARVTIADEDGQTTLRTRPSSRSEARRTVPNGTKHRVDGRRGRWLYLGAHLAWVHASNATCEP